MNGQPQLALKEQYSAIEEARADLVALYFVPEPRIAEFGLLPAEHQDEIVLRPSTKATRAMRSCSSGAMREGTTIEEDHMRNRQMIVHWLLAHTQAIDVRVRDGKTYYVMVDAAAFHEGSGRLLAEVQRIKSEGDYAAAGTCSSATAFTSIRRCATKIVARVER